MKYFNHVCPTCQNSFLSYDKTRVFCTRSCASSRTRPKLHNPEHIVARFWAHVDKTETGCWLWNGNRDKRGYGQFQTEFKHVRAHRFAFEIMNGPVPENMFICHRCDRPACVNPDHLFIGTPQDNNEDKMQKGRNPVGEKVVGSKLKPPQILKIRELHATGNYRIVDLAEMFGVDFTNISAITTRKTWKHI